MADSLLNSGSPLEQALNDPRPVTVGGLNKVYRYIMSRISGSSSSGSAFYKIQGSKDTFKDLIKSGEAPDVDEPFILTQDTEFNPGKKYYKKVNDDYVLISDKSEFNPDTCYEYVNEYYEGELEGYIYNVVEEDPTGAIGVNYVCIKQYRIYYDGHYQVKEYKTASELGQSEFSNTVVYYTKNSDGTYSVITHPEKSQFNPNTWYEYVFVDHEVNGTLVTKNNIENYWEEFWDSFSGSQPIASGEQLGVIKIGTNVNISSDGKISVKTANGTGTLGLVKQGENVTISNGVISVATGSDSLGLAKSGTATKLELGAVNLVYDSNTLDVDNNNQLFVKTAQPNTLGIVKNGKATSIGEGGAIDVNVDGNTIGINDSNKLYIVNASGGTIGTVYQGDYVTIESDGRLSANKANGTTPGVVYQGDYVTISNGKVSANKAGSSFGVVKPIGSSNQLINSDSEVYGVDDSTLKIDSTNKYIYVDKDAIVKSGINTTASDGKVNVTSLTLGDADTDSTYITVTNKNSGSSPAVKIVGKKNTDTTEPNSTNSALYVDGNIRSEGNISGSKVFHAVWNDISDAIEVQDDLEVEPGFCYMFDGKTYKKTEEYCQKGVLGIHSDTAGDILGRKGKHKELDIAIGGFVLAYVDKEYESGTPLTCSVNGILTEMAREDVREYPERLIATYWKPETETLWGPEGGQISVNGRHWIKIK